MATITTSNFATLLPYATLKGSTRVQAAPNLGLPVMASRGGRVRCSLEEKAEASCKGPNTSMVASMMTAASAMGATTGPAMALVDERMTTEGIGLPFGLSNNLLVWILLGVFALIWALYIVYTSTLEEDEESGLSL